MNGAASLTDNLELRSEHVPDWFAAAIANRPDHGDTEVEGSRVHYRCWGDVGRPGLLFVHGAGGHSGWWDHIAPFFADAYRVVAVDLTGHGDSDHRLEYSPEQWAVEALHAASAGGIDSRPHVVGHSMGGFVTATIGTHFPSSAMGLVIIDSLLDSPSPETSRLSQPSKFYETQIEISTRFTLAPAQKAILPYIRRHVVAQSIRATDKGWTWKFDGHFFRRQKRSAAFDLRKLLPRLTGPVTYLRSEHGLVAEDTAHQFAELSQASVISLEIPDAGHHPMMDQPLALVVALRAALARPDWHTAGSTRHANTHDGGA